MDSAVIILADTLIYASWLFIASAGLSLVFGVLRILNLAHGSLYALGAYAAATTVGWLGAHNAADWLMIVAMAAAALLVSLIVGPLLERFVLVRFYGRSEVSLIFVTYALLLVCEALILAVWGVQPYYAGEPYMAFGQISIGNLEYVGYDIFLVLIAVVVGLGLHLFMTKTVMGRLTVAVIHNAEVSAAMGVRVSRVYVTMFTLGVFLAVLAGALTAPMIAVQPGIGINIIVVSFAVVVIGGLGSIPGAAVGTIIVAAARTLSVHKMPELELFSVFFVMSLILIMRPEGLFPPQAVRRI